jgi:ABC-2 type transport system ATP-binding protein
VSDAPPVETRSLVKRYGEIVAVDHVDLTVAPGEFFGYLGPNGALASAAPSNRDY